MKKAYILFLTLVACKTDVSNNISNSKPEYIVVKDSILNRIGEPTSLDISDTNKFYAIVWVPKDDNSYFNNCKNLKGVVDKTLNMLPTKVVEGERLFNTLYDHYEWEKPSFKIVVENFIDLQKNEEQFRNKVVIELK